jgi:O-antigen ligase
MLDEGISQNPYWGLGPRSDLTALRDAGLDITEVHNDYISVRYNYGWVGLALLLFAFIFQIIDLIRLNNKKWSPIVKLFSASALTLFIPFFGFMYTDNILKYTIFFSTIHFIFIGIIHSINHSKSQPIH